jgi:hypothetical protein
MIFIIKIFDTNYDKYMKKYYIKCVMPIIINIIAKSYTNHDNYYKHFDTDNGKYMK